MKLTDRQYQVLLDLWNEFRTEFDKLSAPVQDAFYDRLWGPK